MTSKTFLIAVFGFALFALSACGDVSQGESTASTTSDQPAPATEEPTTIPPISPASTD